MSRARRNTDLFALLLACCFLTPAGWCDELPDRLLTVATAERFLDGELQDLTGYTHLEDSAADLLQMWQGPLHLKGLASLTDEQAESLSRHHGPLLDLQGLKSVSDQQVESLSFYSGDIDLSGLTSLTDSQAESLRHHELHALRLNGLTDRKSTRLNSSHT